MQTFIITCTDQAGKLEKRLEVRQAHLARLKQLEQQGQLVLAGPMPKDPNHPKLGFYGSVLILKFESRTQLDEWLAEEPYLLAGVYAHIDVKPFIQVLPQG